MLWVLLCIFAGFVLVDVLFQIAGIIAILPILERSPPFAVEPSSPAPAAERISFKTADGLTINGSLHLPVHGSPVALVIFCPELGGDHWSATWYCPPSWGPASPCWRSISATRGKATTYRDTRQSIG